MFLLLPDPRNNLFQGLKNHLKIFSLFFAHHMNYFIGILFVHLQISQSHFLSFICRLTGTVYKNTIMQTIFFSLNNNRAFTFLKNSFIQKIKNHFSAFFKNLRFKIKTVKMSSQSFVNTIKIIQTPFFGFLIYFFYFLRLLINLLVNIFYFLFCFFFFFK